jgi:MFS family permease
MTSRERPSVLGLVFLTVLLDMIGFSVIFPLLPALLQYYVQLEGPASLLGRFVDFLSWGATDSFTVVALFGGVLGSIYSMAQFVFAPIWGNLSDRLGRRPTLLITLAGTMSSYVLWFISGSFALFVLARLLGGVMAGNVSTASAAIADSCEGSQRAKGMGILGAGIGLGFVIGPALGGLTASWNLLELWPGGRQWGVNPFSGCALVAFGLATLNWTWVWWRFPETLSLSRPAAATGASHPVRTWNPLGTLRHIDLPGVRLANLSYFYYFIAFAAMEFTLPFLAVQRLGYRPRDNAWMFVFIGLTIALVQGGMVRRLAPRWGERRLATTGIALTLPGMILVGLTASSVQLYAGLAFLAVGSALVMPCLSALVSRYSPATRQGLALGVFRSLGALARAIGPIVGGLIYWSLGSGAPYVLGGLFLLLPLALAWRLPPVDSD